MVFVSGQTAWNAQKNIVGGDSLLEQARQALRNVKAAIEGIGGTLKDVVALRIYIVNYQADSAGAVASALREFFSPRIRRQVPGSASRPWQFQNF
jgi:enamine deaminase RidA (YjgF/YER057c/UK114 family)